MVFEIAYGVQWWSKLQVKDHDRAKMVLFAKVLEMVTVEIFSARGT
jgi:hypothetical protein